MPIFRGSLVLWRDLLEVQLVELSLLHLVELSLLQLACCSLFAGSSAMAFFT
jgi:hypothetical protein